MTPTQSSAPEFSRFIPICKVDEAKRMVYGYAAEEAPDRGGEIMDYAASKPFWEEWSKSQAEASGGKSLGNVRAMHSPVVAGHLEHFEPMDEEKRFFVGAKVTDDAQWGKVTAGDYTGFSVGGSYAWKKKDGELIRYAGKPQEISLVDRPAMSGAVFTMVKADGTTQEIAAHGREIKQVWACGIVAGHEHLTKSEAVKCEGEVHKAERTDEPNPKEGESKYGDVKFADEENKKYPIDTEAHIRAAWNYINKSKNAAKYTDGGKSVKAKIVAAWKAKIDKEGPPSAAEAKKIADGELRKCLYGLSDMTSAIRGLLLVHEEEEYEAMTEGDQSPIPDRISGLISEAYAVLAEMVAEEAKEFKEEEAAEGGAAMNMEAGEAEMPMSMAVSAVLKKIEGNSDALRQRLEKRAAGKETEMDSEELRKVMGEQTEGLFKRFEAALAPVNEKLSKIDKIEERLGTLEKSVPAPGSKIVPARTLEKGADNGDEKIPNPALAGIDLNKRENNEEHARALAKVALSQPVRVL